MRGTKSEPPTPGTREGRQGFDRVPLEPAVGGGDLTEELLASSWWSDAMVRAAGIPIVDVPFVTVGGGIGSFVTVDYLRIAGVAPERNKCYWRWGQSCCLWHIRSSSHL